MTFVALGAISAIAYAESHCWQKRQCGYGGNSCNVYVPAVPDGPGFDPCHDLFPTDGWHQTPLGQTCKDMTALFSQGNAGCVTYAELIVQNGICYLYSRANLTGTGCCVVCPPGQPNCMPL